MSTTRSTPSAPAGRRLAGLLLSVLTLAVVAQPAAAHGGGPANVAIATNTVDGYDMTRTRTRVAVDLGSTEAAENVAIANASCTGCRTVAVAVQVALVDGSANHSHPANAAVASNGGCSGCFTYAYAHQVLLRVDRPVTVRFAAQEETRRLTAAITAAARNGGTDHVAMTAELDGLVAELVAVLKAEAAAAAAGVGQATGRQVRAA